MNNSRGALKAETVGSISSYVWLELFVFSVYACFMAFRLPIFCLLRAYRISLCIACIFLPHDFFWNGIA